MTDGREEMLNRLTLAGWLLLVVNGGVCCIVAPLLLVNLCPAILEGGGRVAGWTMGATLLLCGGAGFFLGKWLLEKCGITILRPPPPSCGSRDRH